MDTLSVSLKSADEKVMFCANARENPEIVIDYFPPIGSGNGYTSLELLMASYGSCLGTTVLTLLRHKMHKAVRGMLIEVKGTVRNEHPKSLRHMLVTVDIEAEDLAEQEVQQAIKAAEDICPVWAMLKGNVEIDIEANISG